MGKKDKEKKDEAENIKVIVRCRPLNSKELDAGYKPCVEMNLGESQVQVNHVCGDPDRWTFDAVVNHTYMQKDIFNQFIQPMIDSVMEGFNATVFAYGQSGSGKTHTMTGKLDIEELRGIIPRTFDYVFSVMREQQKGRPGRTFGISCTFVELYNGKIHDLLAKQQVPLAVKENKDKTFFVQGVSAPQVKFPEDLARHMEEGTDRRRVASTDLNADSSRSHSLFTLIIDIIDTEEDGTSRSVTAKFNLVDLAGSERQSKTGAGGDTLKEGCNINLSLSALGTVIDTLVKGKGHVPFRSSPLTMLLKDSLGGSSKTVMFANIGPSEHNLSETVSTLRFADRAKQIKNKPVVNLDAKDQKIQELTDQVTELREKLKQFESVGVAKMEEELEALRERVGELEVDLDNAVKGREADQLETQQARDALVADIDKTKAELAETTATVQGLEAESKLAANQLRDERAQREEIWSSCTAHFGEEVADVDGLLTRLRQLASSIPEDQHIKAVSELRAQNAAAQSAKDEVDAELARVANELKSSETEIESLRKKLEKTKERLDKEKDARKMLVQESSAEVIGGSPSKSYEDTHSRDLQRRVDDLQAKLNAAGSAEQLQHLVAAKDAEIQRLNAQIHDFTNSASDQVDGDSAEVTQLKMLVRQKDETIHATNERLAALEAAPPRRQSHTHSDGHAQAQALQEVTAQRDALMQQVAGESQPDVAAELQRLLQENDTLRAEQRSGAGHGDAEQLRAALSAAEAALEDARASSASREAELISKIAQVRPPADGDAAEESDGDNDNPLQSVVEMLQREKAALLAELDRLRQEEAMRGVPGPKPAAAAAREHELQEEVARLHEVLAKPSDADSERTAQLKEELRRRDEQLAQLEADAASARDSAATSPMRRDDVKSQELHSRVHVLELEVSELKEQLETAATEAADQEARREAARAEANAAAADAAGKSKESSELRVKITALENTIADMLAEKERVAKENSSSTGAIESLNARLKERTEQMAELRSSIEHMKEVADAHKAKVEQMKATMAAKQAEQAEREVAHQRALAEQEASFQRLMIRRLEEQSEDHKRALARKDDDIHAARKRAKKMEDRIEKIKEKYDQQVYEYEELLSRLEEQKFEAMRNLRDRDTVEIEEEQTKVQDALKAAKERNRRRADQFASGEVNSAVSGLRSQPAGSAAAMARARGGVTPPSEEIERQRSARPAGYQVGRAVVREGTAATGGTGYTGYVPEPPRSGYNNGPSMAMNGGFDAVQDDYLDMGAASGVGGPGFAGGAAGLGGGGGGGDIYDF